MNATEKVMNKTATVGQTRRSFLGFLTKISLIPAALVACPIARATTPSRRHVLLNDFHIAGFRYYDGCRALPALAPGTALNLRAQPTNPHDVFAVEIFHGDAKLGYVPRHCNRHLSRMLLDGVRLHCETHTISPESEPWEAVAVRIYLPHPSAAVADSRACA